MKRIKEANPDTENINNLEKEQSMTFLAKNLSDASDAIHR
jgi:rRNA maturation endonuclease Nob1